MLNKLNKIISFRSQIKVINHTDFPELARRMENAFDGFSGSAQRIIERGNPAGIHLTTTDNDIFKAKHTPKPYEGVYIPQMIKAGKPSYGLTIYQKSFMDSQNASPEGIATHEGIHTINRNIEETTAGSPFLSELDSFKNAMEADIKIMPAEARLKLDYYITKGKTPNENLHTSLIGRDEALSQSGEIVKGTVRYKDEAEEFQNYFPATIAAARDILSQYNI